MRTIVSKLTGALLLLGLLWPSSGATAASTPKTYYLRNSGSPSFNLTLAETAGTATTEIATTFKDLPISTSNTSFAVAGTWGLAGLLPNQAISDLGSASLWIGNSNSDQNGLNADVRVEVLKNSNVISTVDSACIALGRVPSSAASIDLAAPISPVHFDAGDILALRVSARRAVGCSGHNSGVFRLHYNRSNRASNFGATITTDADLSITKTDNPDPVTAGTNLTYTATVTNNGPNNATGVAFSDPLPAGVTLVSATPSQGSPCTGSSTVSCNLGTINAGNNATVTIVVNVGPGVRGSLSNTASVTATQPDPTTPNTATALTTVQASADLSITKTDDPDPVTAGESLTYTIKVTNGGPSTANAVTVTDSLPGSLTLVSATPSQGAACTGTTTVSCNLGTLNVGSSATVTIVATVSPSATGTISNTAAVAATEPDPTTPNQAAASTTVQAKADLSITKTDSPDPVLPGGSLTYTITVTNGGPSTATAVTVTDPLPASLTFVSCTSSQGACAENTGTVTSNLGTLNVGGSATVTIVATVSLSATGTISNTASVAATEPDPTTPNQATATTAVSAPQGADLSVSKTDDPDPVLQGKELTYTITVHNGGPGQATGVTLTDTLPAGVAFVSVTPGSPTCEQASGIVTCDLGSIDNGSDSVVTIKVKPGAAAAQAGTITNTASVSSTSSDTNSGNDSDSEDTAVTKDADGDGIPDDDDCTPTLADDHVVGPPGVVPPTFTGIRHDTLQEAVIAALDNQVISLLANTTENVVIGDSTGSGGKDLLIFGCGHRVTAASAGLPVIRVENSAGANDGDTGMGERDIEFVDVDVRNGSGGYLVETSRVAGAGTDTLLKGVRSESSSGIGIKVVGSGNEVRGSNGVKFHGGFGIQVIGDANLITENGIQDNAGIGLDVTGNNSLIKKNKAGEDGHGNLAGIHVAGGGNDLLENDVFANAGDGINVSGDGNLLQKNDVGDRDKGNTGDGIHVSGAGNTVDENNVFASGGDGIDVGGGTLASPNVVKNNDVGDRNKGNQGNGILVAGLGNAELSPFELDGNTVKSNLLAGIKVTGSGHQLRNNDSGGSGDQTNGDCEYDLASGNVDAGGNTADGAGVALTIPGCTGTP